MCMQQNAKSLLFLRLGLVALAIANIFTYVLSRTHTEMDFVIGMLFGFSFTLLITAMVRRNDTPPTREA
jgi:membrane protein implicated in regulation of membrane protease activity